MKTQYFILPLALAGALCASCVAPHTASRKKVQQKQIQQPRPPQPLREGTPKFSYKEVNWYNAAGEKFAEITKIECDGLLPKHLVIPTETGDGCTVVGVRNDAGYAGG